MINKKEIETSSKYIDWIYQIRGLAIVAVVICHQQGLLHTSEEIQCLTLYSVSTLIFLMGCTEALWLNKGQFAQGNILKKMLLKSLPVLCEYFIAIMAYDIYINRTFSGSDDYNIIFSDLLSFYEPGPLYFIEYYFTLTLISPIIYWLICEVSHNDTKWKRIVLFTVLLVVIFCLGYKSTGWIHCLGSSYLAVYTAGMIWGRYDCKLQKYRLSFILGLSCLLFGYCSTHRFYFGELLCSNPRSGIDKLVPRLSMNPPNLSILFYSAGIILTFAIVFSVLNRLHNSMVKLVCKVIATVGKYSLDIFIWHLFIQCLLSQYFLPDNIWLRRGVYYMCMLFIPMLARKLYNKCKQRMMNFYQVGKMDQYS